MDMNTMNNTAVETTATPVTNQVAVVPQQDTMPVAPVQGAQTVVPEGFISKDEARRKQKNTAIACGVGGAVAGAGTVLVGALIKNKIKEHKAKKQIAAQQNAPAPAPNGDIDPADLANQPAQATQQNQATPAPNGTANNG